MMLTVATWRKPGVIQEQKVMIYLKQKIGTENWKSFNDQNYYVKCESAEVVTNSHMEEQKIFYPLVHLQACKLWAKIL